MLAIKHPINDLRCFPIFLYNNQLLEDANTKKANNTTWDDGILLWNRFSIYSHPHIFSLSNKKDKILFKDVGL